MDNFTYDLDKASDAIRNNLLWFCGDYGNFEICELLLKRYADLTIDYTLCTQGALTRPNEHDIHGIAKDQQLIIGEKLQIIDLLITRGLFVWPTDKNHKRQILSNTFPEAICLLLRHNIVHIKELSE